MLHKGFDKKFSLSYLYWYCKYEYIVHGDVGKKMVPILKIKKKYMHAYCKCRIAYEKNGLNCSPVYPK